MVTFAASTISLFARHFTQYPVSAIENHLLYISDILGLSEALNYIKMIIFFVKVNKKIGFHSDERNLFEIQKIIKERTIPAESAIKSPILASLP